MFREVDACNFRSYVTNRVVLLGPIAPTWALVSESRCQTVYKIKADIPAISHGQWGNFIFWFMYDL